MSDLDRARAAELRAERIRWRGRSRRMSRASRNMDERLRRMNEQASLLDMRLHRTLFTEALGRYQPVEKVGMELKATTNRARKAPKTGVFGIGSGPKASTKGVFQRAVLF